MFAASKTAGVSGAVNYIEDVFSTWLYTGNGTGQTITNGIDLSTKGGLVWQKGRVTQTFTSNHNLSDTARGVSKILRTNSTVAQQTTDSVTAFNSNGFTIGLDDTVNENAKTYVSWTFRKQPKFFDVVTYTGTGVARQISHSLNSVPGCIIVKRTDAAANWQVWHTSVAAGGFGAMNLNTTAAAPSGNYVFRNASFQTSTEFGVDTDSTVNASGGTYVAYLFASSSSGGFGLTGTDNVISCGSYTGNGSATGPVVTLGYEPQWLMIKKTSNTGNWQILDNMRGMPVGSADGTLQANLSNAESSVEYASSTATGFQITSTNTEVNTNAATYIYIAIRIGPMKVPTSGTSVFGLSARSGTGANATVTGGQTDDAVLVKNRGSAVDSLFSSRLTGTGYLVTSTTAAEVAAGTTILQANPWDVMDGVKVGTTSTITNDSSSTFVNYLFKRASNFFDVVCYTGTGSATTQTHNLGVVPELMLFKQRSSANNWLVYNSTSGPTKYMNLNTTSADITGAQPFNNTAPTSTVFTVNTSGGINASGQTYVAYLFATLAGVSKVGSYTGNGTTQTIDCGLTAGARFVLIKRTDSTGDWYVYDTARGMTTLTDPYWLTDSSAAEVATLGSVTTVSTGFAVNSTILAAINVNAGTYIFLAIA